MRCNSITDAFRCCRLIRQSLALYARSMNSCFSFLILFLSRSLLISLYYYLILVSDIDTQHYRSCSLSIHCGIYAFSFISFTAISSGYSKVNFIYFINSILIKFMLTKKMHVFLTSNGFFFEIRSLQLIWQNEANTEKKTELHQSNCVQTVNQSFTHRLKFKNLIWLTKC